MTSSEALPYHALTKKGLAVQLIPFHSGEATGIQAATCRDRPALQAIELRPNQIISDFKLQTQDFFRNKVTSANEHMRRGGEIKSSPFIFLTYY